MATMLTVNPEFVSQSLDPHHHTFRQGGIRPEHHRDLHIEKTREESGTMKMITIAVDRGLTSVGSESGTRIVLQPMRDNPGICIMIWTVRERSMLTCAMTIVPTHDKAEIGDHEHEVALLSVECQMNWIGILSDG